jgi:glycine betaine/proline transport system ATP-binding protein
MQDELLVIQKKLGKTILFITHDINEAFRLGNRLAIMRDGRIIQSGTPESFITGPAEDYVKSFVKSSDKSAILSVGMIMRSAEVTANVDDDESLKKAAEEALKQGISHIYLVDSQSKFSGVVLPEECKPGTKPTLDQVTVYSDTKVVDVFPLAVEVPYPLPIISSNGVFLCFVSKSILLRVLSLFRHLKNVYSYLHLMQLFHLKV